MEKMNVMLSYLDFATSLLAVLFSLLHLPSRENEDQTIVNTPQSVPNTSSCFHAFVGKLQLVLCICFSLWIIYYCFIEKDSHLLIPYALSLYLFYGAMIFKCFFCRTDHNMSSNEMDAFMLVFVLRRHYIQRFTSQFQPVLTSVYREVFSIIILSVNWLVMIFSFIVLVSLLFNTICKRFSLSIKRLPRSAKHPVLTLKNWMVEKYQPSPLYYCFFPLLFVADFLKNILIAIPYLVLISIGKYIVFAYNSFFIQLCLWQREKTDTEIIRFDFKLSLVVVLASVYIVAISEKTFSSEAMDIFNFVSTALILPILLEGLMELRKARQYH